MAPTPGAPPTEASTLSFRAEQLSCRRKGWYEDPPSDFGARHQTVYCLKEGWGPTIGARARSVRSRSKRGRYVRWFPHGSHRKDREAETLRCSVTLE